MRTARPGGGAMFQTASNIDGDEARSNPGVGQGFPAAWQPYVERIELYCAASKLTTDEDKRAVLLSCCGPETYSLIATLVKPSRPPNVDYQVIVDAVKKHVNPKPSELYARKTQDHGNADCLSRLPAPLTRQETEVPGDILLLEAVEYPPVSAREVAAYTSSDPQLSQVKKWILEGWPRERVAPEYSAYEVRQNELSVHRDCVLWGSRVLIPEALQKEVLSLMHANHPGVTAMKAIARSYVWWPHMDRRIEELVRCCRPCQVNRPSEPKTPTHFWTKPERPWSRIHVDFAGPIQGVHFLVAVDALSNWAEVEVMPSLHSVAVIEKFRKMFAAYGLPDLVVSDNGTAFASRETQDFLKRNGIRYMYTAPYHPSSNGRAERMVRELKCSLRKQRQGTVQCKVSRFLFKQHSTPHS
ncbi:uncharacterized protein K02A2.6-like [Dermacentor silvarum]|uniref:uncharacterized protein K02A2.6-like n=1 Tax=Dermacentor silvarum TaxID=543639 RepID=UPI00210069E9|nr:uncharacterized protein K02A2.6-like [Dermacentor silvarum]